MNIYKTAVRFQITFSLLKLDDLPLDVGLKRTISITY